MNDAVQSFLHVSQNIPTRSELVVRMRQPRNSQVEVSQAVPRSSPLSWTLEGDQEINQVTGSQAGASHQSPPFSLRFKSLRTQQTAAAH